MKIFTLKRFSIHLLFLLLPFFVFGQGGEESFTVSVMYGENNEPPTVPHPVTATPIASTQIDIDWGASTDPFGVAGYQVFRDGNQIATTTATLFSDTGLQASTTYSYFIRAFDVSANISSSSITVATTTFDIVVPVPEIATKTSRITKVGRAHDPELVSFKLLAGVSSVYISFVTSVPTLFSFHVGEKDVHDGQVIQTEVFKKEHETLLSDLEPGKTYAYQLIITDRYNQKVVVKEGAFNTDPKFEIAKPPNVKHFQVYAVGNDVFIDWHLPVFENFKNVRIVRNHRSFPVDPYDGILVYEGRSSDFLDIGALRKNNVQYYTIFVYDRSENYSSGAISLVWKAVQRPAEIDIAHQDEVGATVEQLDDDTVDLEPEDVLRIFRLRFTDVEVLQNDTLLKAFTDTILVDKHEPFLIRVPFYSLPENLKIATVSISRPEGVPAVDSYLLQKNSEADFYEAKVYSLNQKGLHKVTIIVYDLKMDEIYQIQGYIDTYEESSVLIKDSESSYIILLYVVVGILLSSIFILTLWLIYRSIFGLRTSV